jgi:hypothetical protein
MSDGGLTQASERLLRDFDQTPSAIDYSELSARLWLIEREARRDREPDALLADLEAFAGLLEAEWYNGNLDEPAYLRLNRDLGGVISKHRQLALREPAP